MGKGELVTVLLLKAYLHSDSNLGLQVRYDIADGVWQVQLMSLPDHPGNVTEDTPPIMARQLCGAEAPNLLDAIRGVVRDYANAIIAAVEKVERSTSGGNGKA